MNEIWAQSQDNYGICGASNDVDRAEDDSPDMVAIRNDYRWTPACQRAFLEELACCGSVLRSVKHVGKSARSAYGLRFRRDGAAFRLGWEAAVLVARAALADMLMDRAIHGYEETTVKQDDFTTLRGKYDNRLSKGLLDRLDKMAEAKCARGGFAAQVQLVVQDFESFLELIGKGGMGSEAALFLAAREADDPDTHEPAIESELAQISDGLDADDADETGENVMERCVGAMSVWFDEANEVWQTDFPLCDQADAALVEECGQFGDLSYTRTLTPKETEVQIALEAADLAMLRAAAIAAHAEWFGGQQAA
jgi:hypothetical protein